MKFTGARALLTLLSMEALLIAWVWTQNGQELPAGSLSLKAPAFASAFSWTPKAPVKADSLVADILKQNPVLLDTADVLAQGGPLNLQIDSANLTPAPRIRILNPQDSASGKYALDAFFESLARLEADSSRQGPPKVRIAHYGDSQIEGDRITQFLRYSFQKRFGGTGIGYVQLTEPATHHALTRTPSGNWKRFTVFQNRSKSAYYSLAGVVFRYGRKVDATPRGASPDSTATQATTAPASAVGTPLPGSILVAVQDTNPPQTEEKSQPQEGAKPEAKATKPAAKPVNPGSQTHATLLLEPVKRLRYDRLTLLWGNSVDPVRLTATYKGKTDSVLMQDTLWPAIGLIRTTIPGARNDRHIQLAFDGPTPDVYGLLFDGESGGIAVDNFGLRGHSGNGLARIDGAFLTRQVNVLGTRLIIFQYGGNIVPYDVPSFKFFEDDVYRMLMRYRRLAPGASLLVIGVGDMGVKTDGEWHSYPTVEKIRDAQKRAAQRAGVAFYDLYDAMGGKDAIVSWVNAEVPLAATDFAHFSTPGQRLVANWLYQALMYEYDQYKLRRAPRRSRPSAATAADSNSSNNSPQ